MNSIVPPLKLGDSGPSVANLQDALLALLGHQLIHALDAPNHPTADELKKLAEGLKQERTQSLFGKATQQLVMYFQVQQGLGDNLRGLVETTTAAKLNELLASIGLLDDGDSLVVRGTVRNADDQPIGGAAVRAFDRDLRKEQPIGDAVTDDRGEYRIAYSPATFASGDVPGAASPRLIVRAFLGDQQIGDEVSRPRPLRDEVVDFKTPAPAISEWEKLSTGIMPLLEGQGKDDQALPPWELTDADADFIAKETGLESASIRLWARAFVVGREAAAGDITPIIVRPVAPGNPLDFAIFFGWFREGLPDEWAQLRTQRIALLRQTALDAMAENIIPAAIRDRLESFLQSIPNPDREQLKAVLGTVGLGAAALQGILARADSSDAISDSLLGELTAANTITAQEADSVGLSLSVSRLSPGNVAVASTIIGTVFDSLGGRKPARASDLATLEPADWQTAIEQSGVPLPAGATSAGYARALAVDAARAFPNAALLTRATKIPAQLEPALNSLQPLLKLNPDALLRDFDELSLTGIPASDLPSLREAHRQLQQLANLHPGLDLFDVMAGQSSVAGAVATVSTRIGWLQQFQSLNADTNFLGLDYLPGSADLDQVKFGSLDPAGRQQVVNDLKAYQRIHAVAGNSLGAHDLLVAGYHSASVIARSRVDEFLVRSGLEESEARAYYATARIAANDAALRWASVFDATRDAAVFNNRMLPSADQFFPQLAGYADLFGSQTFCNCRHCQSVLSPAAYFVDLMYYIEQNILAPSFSGQTAHPLHLKIRRPDLWVLPLTCANTEDYVPQLDVVNVILETYVEAQRGLTNATAVYQMLAQQKSSFQQPFTLPLERLEILLGHFALSRADLVKAMAPGSNPSIRARLKLSQLEFDLITVSELSNIPPLTNLPGAIQFLQSLYKIGGNWSTFSFNDKIEPPFLQPFVAATGLDRATIGQVLESTAVNADGSANAPVTIEIGVVNPAANVQNNAEEILNLSVNRLDRIHRFVRLWRKLPWTVGELDYVLQRLQARNLGSGLEPVALQSICRLLDLNANLSVAVDELLALWDVIPRVALRDGDALFDRLFNQATFVAKDGAWPAAGLSFVHPALNPDPAAAGTSLPKDNTLTRLLAGLQVSDKDLVRLIRQLGTPLGLTNGAIALTESNLNVLYRHARLARVFNVSIDDLFRLIVFTKTRAWSTTSTTADNLADLEAVTEFASWQTNSGYSLAEISYVTGGPAPAGVADPATIVDRVLSGVVTDKSLQFADNVLTQIGLTNSQSQKIVADNLGQPNTADGKAFEPLPDGLTYRLKADFDPALPANVIVIDPVTIALDPTTLAAHPDLNAEVRELLGRYHALRVLDVALGSALNKPPEGIQKLRTLVRPSFVAADAADLARTLQGDPDTTKLTSLASDLLRYRALFKDEGFDTQALDFVGANRAVFLLPANPLSTGLTTDAVRNAASYVALTVATDAGFSTASVPVNTVALQAVLVAGVTGASDADLADALRTDVARIGALRPQLPPPTSTNPFVILATVARCLGLTELLGVSGEILRLAASDDFTDLTRAAEDIYGAFRAKYPDDQAFQAQVEPYDDQLRGRKRDGLVGYMTTAWSDPFATPSSLYEYFLIDVQMAGCARTSQVVAGLSSLQLYVQRVLMNLERSSDYDGRVPPLKGVYARFTDPDKRAEWYWRQNYRVWEANRKVFLYPENYLEPELRDDKTPLFKELEDTLLQQEITEQHVLDAYGKYLAGFEEVARLKIAGAYHDKLSTPNVLHLFGATPGDPPNYYYRAIEGIEGLHPLFRPWTKLAAPIPVRVVSPIIYQGRLYVFWVEITSQAQNKIVGGTSIFGGYRHRVAIKYIALRLDNTWTAPQTLKLSGGVFGNAVNIIDDATVFGTRVVFVPPLNNALAADLDLANPDLKKSARVILAMVFPDLKTIRAEDFVVLDATDINVTNGVPQMTRLTVSIVSSWRLTVPNPADSRWGVDQHDHADDYTLTGYEWDRVYPYVNGQGDLIVQFGIFASGFPPQFTGVVRLASNDTSPTNTGQSSEPQFLAFLEGTNLGVAKAPTGSVWSDIVPYGKGVLATEPEGLGTFLISCSTPTSIATSLQLDCALQAVNGSAGPNGMLLSTERDLLYLYAETDWQTFYARRLGSTIPDTLVALFGGGGPQAIDALLDLGNQKKLREDPVPFAPVAQDILPLPAPPAPWKTTDLGSLALLDYSGAFGTYYREVFFHVPFLIANHLNGQQQFAATQRWYHRIFNPTSVDRIPWRYAEFPPQFDPKAEGLRAILTDSTALDSYRRDPFNPHAIARARLSAYQKAIVMKYVANLLDWGDSLFTQFTMESINEATMLYVMASDILGPRPPELGSCGEGGIVPKTYAAIQPALNKTSDFLVELENLTIPNVRNGDDGIVVKPGIPSTATGRSGFTPRILRLDPTSGGFPAFGEPNGASPTFGGSSPIFGGNTASPTFWTNTNGTPLLDVEGGFEGGNGVVPITGTGTTVPLIPSDGVTDFVPGFGPSVGPIDGSIYVYGNIPSLYDGQVSVPQQIPGLGGTLATPQPLDLVAAKLVFCIPENGDLLAYWDRVEQRLFNIRNCMDIAGVRRQPELFAPEIDPRLLVRMTAAGLTLDDVLNATSGDLPPYRFSYLIDRAKQHAATVQSFGAQLLSALENRDTEELAQLRAVHEQNLLKMRDQAMQREIDAAEDTVQSLLNQKATVEYRRDHFASLQQSGLSDWEIAQATAIVASSSLFAAEAVIKTIGAIAAATPNAGAPTAMTYGGREIHSSLALAAGVVEALAGIAQNTASATGIAATFSRRDEDWTFQVETAKREIAQLEKQITAAQFRKEIAENAEAVHQKSIDQAEEVFAFYGDKFSNLGRFNWLSTQLHRLYRTAYNSAYSMAKLAEQAYLFERPDDIDSLLPNSFWDAENAGLLAGEQVLLALQEKESRFVETNYRKLEIEQSFSLLQFAGEKLIDLRRDGTCSFRVPELFFDLVYPGHYRRLIRAVRLTIPCVAGPFSNVGAMLRLTGSQWRKDVTKSPSTLTSVPLRHTVAVAASTAQNDSGVFEFSFRDERFMPFEGAGAISDWTLELPDTFRVFDYDTISDVILRISYTAEEDSSFRDKVEGITGLLMTQLQSQPPKRLFSIRHEFPSEWARFKNTPANSAGYGGLTVSLRPEQYPFWSKGKLNSVKSASLFVETSGSGLAIASDAAGTAPLTATGTAYDLGTSAPATPTSPTTLYIKDPNNSLDELWLLIEWKK